MFQRFDYFEHEADVGIVGRGDTCEAAFESAAAAMFAIGCDLEAVGDRETVEVAFDEDDLELALVTWLNALLSEARVRGLALARFALSREAGRWHGRAFGDRWRPDLERGVEVKGATLTMLSVRQAPDGWEARCVVDV